MQKFLASEIPDLPAADCLFHVIPAPYEKTVSYGGGTALGPAAILDASYQLEAFDGVSCPCEQGIHTCAPALTMEEIEQSMSAVFRQQKIPVLLGGEHSVTIAAIRALKNLPDEVGIIHFDAHADLRQSYEGDPLSHACALYPATECGLPLFQIGVRALSLPEVARRKEKGVHFLDGYDIGRNGLPDSFPVDNFPHKVYLTFDVDALDPSIMPATGTPEPGGLSWFQTLECFERIAAEHEIIGCDFVELAPIDQLHAPDFLVARLIYNLMGMIERQRENTNF